jgi:predicted Zn-dependent protease
MRQALFGALVASAAGFLLVGSAAAQQRNTDIENIGNRDINKGDLKVMVPSVESEIAIGRALARELEQVVTLLNDPAVVDYVNRVSQNIVNNSDSKLSFTVKVIDSAEVNAAALPGGFLYVNTGLIQTADNEAQLAAMISHVVAHVAARHVAEQQGRASSVNILSLPSTVFPSTALAAPQEASAGVPAAFYQFSRRAEEEADWLGLQYLYKAGYDPEAMVAFFQKMATRNGGGSGMSKLFSTHPQIDDRIAKSLGNIKAFLPARPQNVVTTVEFEQIKSRLMERRQ